MRRWHVVRREWSAMIGPMGFVADLVGGLQERFARLLIHWLALSLGLASTMAMLLVIADARARVDAINVLLGGDRVATVRPGQDLGPAALAMIAQHGKLSVMRDGGRVRLGQRQLPVLQVDAQLSQLKPDWISDGRGIDPLDQDPAAQVMLLSSASANRLRLEIGDTQLLGGHPYQLIGHLSTAALAVPLFAGMGEVVLLPSASAPLWQGKPSPQLGVRALLLRPESRFDDATAAQLNRLLAVGDEPPLRWFDANQQQQQLLDQRRGLLQTLGLMAIVALLLGLGGLVAMTLLGVNERRHEFALRRAFGASQVAVVVHVVAETMLLVASASVIGASVLWIGVDQGWLPGVSGPIDWRALAPVGALALGLGVVAAVWPAWRAARVAPMTILRAA
ncbi:ABC transporter permease [Gammaproteobacteria bacterium]|nr:ABC transporter permease [Gammaproteobacteria bacterium]